MIKINPYSKTNTDIVQTIDYLDLRLKEMIPFSNIKSIDAIIESYPQLNFTNNWGKSYDIMLSNHPDCLPYRDKQLGLFYEVQDSYFIFKMCDHPIKEMKGRNFYFIVDNNDGLIEFFDMLIKKYARLNK